jgi:UDP-glucose-4-epimerase GalE
VATKAILVTGGAGYIGSHACRALAAAGFEPIAYDNLSRGNRWAVRWGPLEVGDVRDGARVCAVLERYRPVAVMHFAAFAYVAESMSDPLLYFENNIGGAVSLLQSIVRHGGLPFVFSSTCATYGVPQCLPLTEDHPQQPVNPYGVTKLATERLLQELDRSAGLRSVSLRYFNAAGADPTAEIGEGHDPETHLIPRVLAAATGAGEISIFGDDYETPDGTCVRDFVHVCDIADAHVRALQYLLGGGATDRFNLANSRGYSVMEVIAAAEQVCGRPIRRKVMPRQAGDPPALIGSSVRAHEVLGWQIARPSLTVQIQDAFRWAQKRSAWTETP